MKKLLALVMALVMTLGLATVAANAAYPDAADVELKEAVEVMTAVGVFKGDENGNFKPQANLDRAAAAKLIAYLDLGEKAAEALPAVKAFNDVPATHWAAKYIAYCANAGYVAGAGDGNFYPSNPLTGYAFGKMVLCVLGYDATIEGFTGATWSINVAKLMDSNDIADGVDSAASANLTREQAAQYCLNALKADMVEYDTKGTSIEINGAKIATGASKAESKAVKASTANDAIDSSKNAEGKSIQQLGEKLYGGDLKLASTTNDFNADATEWTYKNSTVGTYADAPTATYNNKVTRGTIYTLLGKDVYDDLKAGNAMLYLSTDGSALASDGVTNVVKGSSGAAFGTGNGTVTEVYVDEDAIGGTYAEVKVIVKNTYVMQATDDYNAKTEKLAVDDISGKAKTTLTADDVADGVDLEGFKEDDFILYTVAGGKVQSMEKATTVSGKVNSYATGSNVTIDGTKYSYSKKIGNDTKHGDMVKYSAGETATVVLDAQGYIIYVDEMTAANDNVVFVLSTGTSGFDPIAKILTVDGKKSTVSVNEKKSDTVVADKVYAYKVDGSEYKLTDYDTAKWGSAAAGTYELYKKTSVFGKKATADTVYIVEDDDGDITMYTGVKNAPETVVTSKTVLFVNNTDDELTYVYVVADGGVDEHSTASDELIYVLKIGNTDKPLVDSDDNEYVEVTALVDGAKTTLNVELSYAKDFLAVGKFFTKKTTDSDGYVTKMTAATDGDDYAYFTVASKDNAFTYSSDVFEAVGAAGSPWYVNTDKVYAVVTGGALLEDPDASYELNETTFKGLQSFVKGYNVSANGWVVLNDDGEATAAYVLITNSAAI